MRDGTCTQRVDTVGLGNRHIGRGTPLDARAPGARKHVSFRIPIRHIDRVGQQGRRRRQHRNRNLVGTGAPVDRTGRYRGRVSPRLGVRVREGAFRLPGHFGGAVAKVDAVFVGTPATQGEFVHIQGHHRPRQDRIRPVGKGPQGIERGGQVEQQTDVVAPRAPGDGMSAVPVVEQLHGQQVDARLNATVPVERGRGPGTDLLAQVHPVEMDVGYVVPGQLQGRRQTRGIERQTEGLAEERVVALQMRVRVRCDPLSPQGGRVCPVHEFRRARRARLGPQRIVENRHSRVFEVAWRRRAIHVLIHAAQCRTPIVRNIAPGKDKRRGTACDRDAALPARRSQG